MPLVPPRALAAVLLVPALAGCTAQAAPAPSATPSASASWPRVPGRVVSQSSTAGQLEVRVAVEDPDAAYVEARRLLVDAGFGLTVDRPANGGGTGQACTPALCVGFGVDTDAQGPGVTYEVFHSTGVVPLD